MDVRRLYTLLSRWRSVGEWWPGDEPFEIAVGAVLTARTKWENAAASIVRLKSLGLLEPSRLASADTEIIGEAVRPSGFYRQKAERLSILASFFLELGGGVPDRDSLLALKGVGPETADSILLYAFDVPVFVVDAYSKRLFLRVPVNGGTDPARMKAEAEGAFSDAVSLKELHGLIVEVCKVHCRASPECGRCPLENECERIAV